MQAGKLMRARWKILLAVLAVVVGLPIAGIATILAWTVISDRTNGTVVSSGVARRYLAHVPKTYDRTRPTALLISFHPAAAWPAAEQAISRWNDLADEHGFIVVYPAGSGAFFGGLGPGPQIWPQGPHTLARDVRFISDLIDKLASQYTIDPDRVYADGISNGGGMAFALSCMLGDRIAAIGAVAAAQTLPWNRCPDGRPVPTIAFHGTADHFAPYHGGASPIAPQPFPDIPDWVARVAQRNRCGAAPSDSQVTHHVRRRAYASCAGRADVVLYTIEGGGHAWPGGRQLPSWIVGRTTDEISASRVMWDFFKQHPYLRNAGLERR